MHTKKILIALVLATLIAPTAAFAQEQEPPGLPAVDFGDDEVPEFETDQEPEEDDIGAPPSLEIEVPDDEDTVIVVDPTPDPTPEEENPMPSPPTTPNTGPGLLLSIIPALGYTINKKLNR